jgi:phosphomannomutase
MGIFKAYDIRGLYPKEIDEGMARRIGNAFARFLKAKRLVVGRDMRTHSPEIARGVIEGIRDAGCDVTDAGLCSTPMAYYAIATEDCDGGLNVTASHNPGQYSGMKLCREGARPISGASGIQDVERRVKKGYPPPVGDRGRTRGVDLLSAFADHVAGFASVARPIRVAIDAANGMGAYTLPPVLERLPTVEAKTLFMELDGTFPNHEANPLKEENLDPVRALVAKTGADFGVGFDGDADRCCFVDERGRTAGADLMTALLAREFLQKYPGAAVVYDLRSSWVVKEEIEKAGGVAVRDRVGHSFIKATMREHGAVFGGELSGHFYFKDHFTCDSGEIALACTLGLVSRSGAPLSELVDGLRRYHATGEINFHVEDKEGAIAHLKREFSDGRQDELDGITVEYGDVSEAHWWWFNVRPSNTESLLRLNLEASSRELCDAKRERLVALLGEPEA